MPTQSPPAADSDQPPSSACSARNALRGLILALPGAVRLPFPGQIPLEAAFHAAFPDRLLIWAHTPLLTPARSVAATNSGIAQVMRELAARGVTELIIQPLHILAGEEFSRLERAVLTETACQTEHFDSVLLGRPLLDSASDAEQTAKAVCADLVENRSRDEAVVLMAHGHAHGRGDLALHAAAACLRRRDPLVCLAALKGTPDFDAVLRDLHNKGVKRAALRPFMLAAGGHARRDMIGEEAHSWSSRLKAEGLEIRAIMQGLGELPGISEVFVRHALETRDNILSHLTKDAAPCAPENFTA